MEIIKSNLWEIKKSGSLKTLGGLIALGHFLQFCTWSAADRLPLKLSEQGVPMCWSFIENCGWMRLPTSLLGAIYYAYPALSVLAAVLFILLDWTTLGYYLLLTSWLMALIMYFQDLRLSTNEGYLLLFVTFAYLYVPSKHRMMRRLLVSFFVARGLSQLAPDWLTGGWYLEHVKVPVKVAEWLAALGVLVQMLGGASLLFRDARYFWTGWLTLFAYECGHLAIGQTMPALGLGALVYIAMDELELRRAEREYIYQSFIRPEPSFILGGLILVVFWAAQLVPFAPAARVGAVKNVLQIWTMQPEASHEECDQATFAVYKDGLRELDVQPQLMRQPTMQCNPYLRYLDLKAACRQLKSDDADFETLSSVFQVRNFREKRSYRAFEVADFCASDLTFKRLGEVQWTTSRAK
jgi:hypothetical protein